ncbi:hypothetical protein TCA2_2987 [Paenibacillus sp. TCA20]|uniref:spore germination protein n=1 Tax=Paenibacillus sp. TCA20 TaxID=1499968 RepID=UPI0004DA3ED8|nr:spore germination protein [Paenibacillus sp. TCA20]GAK40497.1 hypothetical protein TCA2_2987 [Paenibacillus sp. TCA20]
MQPHEEEAHLNYEMLNNLFQNCADVVVHHFTDMSTPITLVYCDGLTDQKTINEIVLPRLTSVDLTDSSNLSSRLALTLNEIEFPVDSVQIEEPVFSGQLLILTGSEQNTRIYTLDIASVPGRTPEESAIESAVKGARDGFTEELTTNVGLIRKRLRTKSFCYEQFVSGERSHTKIALFYVEDIINPEILKTIRERLSQIDTDGLVGTSIIERAVMGGIPSILPLTDMTQRPDYIVTSLLNGRFAVMMEGSPVAIVAPTTLFNQIHSPEDASTPFFMVAVERLLRIFGLFVAALFPGFYIGLTTFNVDQIPLPLLATVAGTRVGLPLPVPLETFMMIAMFELFNEAGRRLPRALGQTVTVVGGLIIGDAAIRAGVTSPTIIVAVAISVISSYMLVNTVLSSVTSLIRLFVLAFASFLGMYGFFIAAFILVIHMASLESYGVRYLSPVTPLKLGDAIQTVLMKPTFGRKKRPESLQTQDDTRTGNKS